MPSKELTDKLVKKISNEIYSSHFYLQMSLDLEEKGYAGFSHWCMCQWYDELSKAIKLMSYCHRRSVPVKLSAVPAPEVTWACPRTAMEAAFKHERAETKGVEELMTQARMEGDYATEDICRWYLSCQIDEEDEIRKIHNKIVLLNDDKNGLMFVDKELKEREAPPHHHY